MGCLAKIFLIDRDSLVKGKKGVNTSSGAACWERIGNGFFFSLKRESKSSLRKLAINLAGKWHSVSSSSSSHIFFDERIFKDRLLNSQKSTVSNPVSINCQSAHGFENFERNDLEAAHTRCVIK